VRRLLATLGAAAAHSGAAVLLVRHLNKPRAGRHVRAAARSALWSGGAPPTPWCEIPMTLSTGCCHREMHLAVEAPTWATRWWTSPPGCRQGRMGRRPRSPQRVRAPRWAPSSALSEAVNWLTTWRSGAPRPHTGNRLAHCRAEAGIARATLHRARQHLRLPRTKTPQGWLVG